ATGEEVADGTKVGLAADSWLIDHSPYSQADLLADPDDRVPAADELDYALIRLADDIGNQRVAADKADQGTPLRGWITPRLDYDFPVGAPVFIVQHPQALPLKLALDTKSVIGVNKNRTRVRYVTNTQPGSSGSPVFTENWELVALHHSGDRRIVP